MPTTQDIKTWRGHEARGSDGDKLGKIVRAVVPGLILAIGTFMVLDQLQIAPQIVTITYAALLGMLALAGALAFGLGGREVAGDLLRNAYDSGQQNKDQVKRDVQQGRQRA